ncbi:MAG: hypothetical protein P9L92_18185 [Candidatus Electryonea clarkiae]|nr:hypothetical protein [Candidatus Electryonea clarkiae]
MQLECDTNENSDHKQVKCIWYQYKTLVQLLRDLRRRSKKDGESMLSIALTGVGKEVDGRNTVESFERSEGSKG